MTSLFLTPDNFEFTESELQDIDVVFDYMLDGKIFPIHRIFNYEKNSKDAEYNEALQDFSFRSYRGKDIFKISYDIRPDYQQLLRQFEGSSLRLLIGMNNNSFLCTKNGENYRGYLLSDLTIEDLDIFNTNLTPLRIELSDKKERDTEEIIKVDYRLYDIDKRIVSINIDVTTTDILESASATLSVKYLDTPVDSLILSDITFVDDKNGQIDFDVINYNGGIYKLTSPDSQPTSGCITINSYGYIGRQRYKLRIIAEYTSFLLMSGDDFELMSGDVFDLINTN